VDHFQIVQHAEHQPSAIHLSLVSWEKRVRSIVLQVLAKAGLAASN